MPMRPFDLDDVTNLVQRDGVSARLSEQEKRLLVLLAERAGKTFDKHALMEALWGRRAEWMEDAALVQLVSRLRRSLAPLGLQRAIVTVPRAGYRLDMPVATLPHAAQPQASALSDTPPVLHGVARDGHGEVHRHGVTVRIPQIEYRLLRALRSPENVAHDKRTLIAMLWPERPDQDDTNLMQVVSRLRRKLIPLGLHRHIVTVPRVGYRFDAWPEFQETTSATPTLDAAADARPPRRQWLASTWVAHAFADTLAALTRHLRWRRR